MRVTLIELATATEAISGAARCLIEVRAGAGLGRDLRSAPTGVLATADREPSARPATRAEFAAPNGNPLGRVSLHYPDHGRDQDSGRRAGRLGRRPGLASRCCGPPSTPG